MTTTDKRDTSEMWGEKRERNRNEPKPNRIKKLLTNREKMYKISIYLLNFWFWSDSGISQSAASPPPPHFKPLLFILSKQFGIFRYFFPFTERYLDRYIYLFDFYTPPTLVFTWRIFHPRLRRNGDKYIRKRLR